MDKPLVLEIQEFKEELMCLLNKHFDTIPASVLYSALQEAVVLVGGLAEQQLTQAQEEYKKLLKESEVKEDGNREES